MVKMSLRTLWICYVVISIFLGLNIRYSGFPFKYDLLVVLDFISLSTFTVLNLTACAFILINLLILLDCIPDFVKLVKR